MMKTTIRKTLLAFAITAATGAISSASAAEYQDFDVRAVIDATTTYAFTADKITGNYVELINFANPGFFNVSLVWTAGQFLADNGSRVLSDRSTTPTGLGAKYGLYALYNASGTVSTRDGITTFTFVPGSGNLEVWRDNGVITAFTATQDNTAFTSVGTSDDVLLATGEPLSGEGTLNPNASTCGSDGINCGSFGSKTSFDLPDAGKMFFVAPNPFYSISLQSGQLNTFTLTGNQRIDGSMDVVFAVPEPTSVALLGLGLVGLGLSRRRNKKS